MTRVVKHILAFSLTSALSVVLCVSAFAQSSDQNFPTPITTNEISGTIKARDLGDARLTTYYYEFDGGQGDIFINVVSKNFSGDIDVFTAAGLRPLTRVVLYADAGLTETGRLVYLRKPERLLLRIEGRTPGDDAATFQIKFAGSFIALQPRKEEPPPTIASLETKEKTDVAVDVPAKVVTKTPRQKRTGTKKAPPKTETITESPSDTDREPNTAASPASPPVETEKTVERAKPVLVIEDYTGVSEEEAKKRKPVAPARSKKSTPTKTRAAAKKKSEPKPEPPKTEESAVDPLASILLVVELKDGTKIEKPMNEVLRFGVDKGVLTVIGKDGSIIRYSVLDVARVTMQ